MRVFVAAVVLFLAGSAHAQPWSGPDPTRRPDRIGAGDIDFAVAELCFPFILQNAPIASVTARAGVLPMRKPPEFANGAPSFFVGQADVIVSLREEPRSRSCTVRVNDGNEAQYRERLGRVLAGMPQPLSTAAQQLPPNDYATRELLCAPPGPGPHDSVLISVGGKSRRTPSMMVSIIRSSTRGARCDGPRDHPDDQTRKLDTL